MQSPLLDIKKFAIHGDHFGNLVALEQEKDIPFAIKRIYYIWGTATDTVRGKHSHHKLQQVIICLSGSCDFLLDNGFARKTIRLDNPAEGLYIGPGVWREFTNFSPDCVILVIASEHYDEADYVRNYNDFLKTVKE